MDEYLFNNTFYGARLFLGLIGFLGIKVFAKPIEVLLKSVTKMLVYF